ncbi:MAG: hypothetical protein QG657_4914 [Acidobacteriota bacterium]|nr:hypothetical protein [Acidobacteriota bacterium]
MMTKEDLLLLEKMLSIRARVRAGEYRFTVHSLERRIERSINKTEIEEAIFGGEIIEDYPEDKYGPSCLILGFTNEGRPIHVQCSLEPVWVITCYDPSQKPLDWDEYFRKRR